MFKKMIYMGAALLMMASAPAFAKDNSSVLYMSLDKGGDFLNRNDPAFRRIFEHTGNYLHHENFRLFEGDGASVQSMDEAKDILAKNGQRHRGLDVGVVVSTRHHQGGRAGQLEDQIITTARIIDAGTLKVLDTVRVKSPVARVQAHKCHGECRDMIMRRHVREVLTPFKERLAQSLHALEPVHPVAMPGKVKSKDQITLTLKGFSPRELRYLENEIATMEGTRDLSSLTSRADKPAFWLERTKSAPDLREQLGQVLARMDMQARIIETRNQVVLQKVDQSLAYLD